MRTALIIFSVLEVLLVIGALAHYLIQISKSLDKTSQHLGKITFGVRAVETQCSSIGPSVTKINEQLTTISGALGGVADRAEAIADSA